MSGMHRGQQAPPSRPRGSRPRNPSSSPRGRSAATMRSRAEILRMTSDRADTSQEMLRELELRPLHILEVDLAAVARGVAAGFGASHRVAVDIPEGTVATDRDLVIEILTDLLVHALENAPDGSNVTICADSEKSGLRLWVSYDGAG